MPVSRVPGVAGRRMCVLVVLGAASVLGGSASALRAQSAGRLYEGQAGRPVQQGTGQLLYPEAVQQRAPTTERDDAEIVKAVEHRIRCTCGCNLDVFTCRTTDFTCATSPAMHTLVLARLDSGLTAEQVVTAFETQYGQAILMQPPKRGFNWTAYIMPFIGLGFGVSLVVALMRRGIRRAHAAGPDEPGGWTAPTSEPKVAAGVTGTGASPGAGELERLRQALDRFEEQ